jgi:hypothetical protein
MWLLDRKILAFTDEIMDAPVENLNLKDNVNAVGQGMAHYPPSSVFLRATSLIKTQDPLSGVLWLRKQQ